MSTFCTAFAARPWCPPLGRKTWGALDEVACFFSLTSRSQVKGLYTCCRWCNIAT